MHLYPEMQIICSSRKYQIRRITELDNNLLEETLSTTPCHV